MRCLLGRGAFSHQTVGVQLWQEGTRPGSIQNMTDNHAQWFSYLDNVVTQVLVRYAELLRAIEGIPSGIPAG